jgi:hypothetical protein
MRHALRSPFEQAAEVFFSDPSEAAGALAAIATRPAFVSTSAERVRFRKPPFALRRSIAIL